MAKRKWDKAIFDKYTVVASPSQFVEYLDCPRKWWFGRVIRLPVVKKQDKFTFGNILHGVLQRWLDADDTGRGPDGQQVNLYPEGWTKDDDGGVVNKRDAQLIQMLVKAAIDGGLLRRTPGRVIEREFEFAIIPGVGCIGAMDIEDGEGIEDHKSTKSRDWISSAKDLANDPKMLAYAKLWKDRNPEATHVRLRLNYMVKDPDDLFTKAVEVLVPADDVERFWNETMIPAAQGMLALKNAKIPMGDWSKVTGPQHPGVCKKYGGCAYAGICSRMKTPLRYKEEIDRANGKLPPIPETPSQPKPVSKPMGIFKKPVGAKPAASPAPASTAAATEELIPQSAPATATAAPPAPETPPAPAQEAPPWAQPKCMACKGTGLNIKAGRACKACDAVSARAGKITSEAFEIAFNQDGTVSWSPKADGAPAKAPSAPPAAPKPTVEPKAAPAPKPAAAPAQAAGKAQVTAPPTSAKPATAPKVKAPEQKAAPAPMLAPASPAVEAMGAEIAQALAEPLEPSDEKGFRLFLNCMPMGNEFVDLATVLAEEGADLANAKGAESFYALDSFKRRDFLAQRCADVARERFDGRDVVVIGGSQDLKAYAEAFRPLAREVFLGVF